MYKLIQFLFCSVLYYSILINNATANLSKMWTDSFSYRMKQIKKLYYLVHSINLLKQISTTQNKYNSKQVQFKTSTTQNKYSSKQAQFKTSTTQNKYNSKQVRLKTSTIQNKYNSKQVQEEPCRSQVYSHCPGHRDPYSLIVLHYAIKCPISKVCTHSILGILPNQLFSSFNIMTVTIATYL